MSKQEEISGDYLETLEKVKEQYQQYLDLSKIDELPVTQEEEEAVTEGSPPSPEHPLTTNSFSVK